MWLPDWMTAVKKQAKRRNVLSSDEGEHEIVFAKLAGQLEAMIRESADPTGFDARVCLARWWMEPCRLSEASARPI